MWSYRPYPYPQPVMSVGYHYSSTPVGDMGRNMGGGGMGVGYQHPAYGGSSMHTSFAFKKRFEQIDWKKIAAADIDSISRNLDFNALQDNIMNITFCNIENEVDVRTMDPNFIKLFKLAQLTIEYLLHSQNYLSDMVGALDMKLRKAVEEHEATTKTLKESQQQYSELKRECHKRKKMLIQQQQILQAGANSYNKCPYCTKAFLNLSFLQSHIQRRHREYASHYSSMINSHYQSMPPPQPQPQPEKTRDEELERELGEIKERLRLTESLLDEERNRRNEMSQKEQEKEREREERIKRQMETQKEEEIQRQMAEIDNAKSALMYEMREMKAKYEAQNELVDELQRKLSRAGSGPEVERERELLRQQREESARMNELLQQQIREMEEKTTEEIAAKLAQGIKSIQEQNLLQMEELNDALEQSVADIEERKTQASIRKEYHHQIQRTSVEISEANASQKQLSELQEVRRSRSPFHGKTTMDPPSDDDTTLATATLKTLHGPDERDESILSIATNRTGSLSLSVTRQAQLKEMIKKNPEFLRGMRQQLESVFQDNLERRGIAKNATGLSAADSKNKMDLLKQERLQRGQKMAGGNFWDIRQQYLNEVNEIAKKEAERHRMEQRTAGPQRQTPLSSSMPLPATRPQVAKSPAANRKQPVVKDHQGAARFTSAAPKPAPRTPRGEGTNGGAAAGVRQSQEYSQADDTVASGQWSDSESEESEEEDSYEDETTGRGATPSPRRPAPAKTAPPVATVTKVTTTTTTKSTRTRVEESESEDDWDDDVSELEGEFEPTSQPRTSTARRSPSPNIATRAASIERQLSGRTAKKPAGAIDTMGGTIGNSAKEEEDDESFTGISDDADDTKPQPRASGVASSMQSDYSNTYNTSAWGASSKGGASTVNPGAGAGPTGTGNVRASSANKSLSKQSTSGDVSNGSDWDDSHDALDISELH